jgi:hypothetical protein
MMSSALRQSFRRERVVPILHRETASTDVAALRAPRGEVVSVSIASHRAAQSVGIEMKGDETKPDGRASVDALTASWRQLEPRADLPDVQEVIRRAIRRRWIRVSVNPVGEIRIRVGKKCRSGPPSAPGAS